MCEASQSSVFPASVKMRGNSSVRNAFAYFVEEYMAEQSELGRHISKEKAVEECTSGWSALEPEKRLKYCNMANPMLNRTNKRKKSSPTPPNMEWLDPITGEYGEKWFRYVRAGDELYYLKKAITSERRLRNINFYFVHFNYFCQPNLKKYVPAELALLEFNLSEGVKNVYHTLINPGSIPLGYAHEAKRNSEDIHGIPTPPMAKGEENMKKVIKSVKEFLEAAADSTGKFPPLFTWEENVLPAMHMLNDMVPYEEDEPVFVVYPIHRMFYWTKNKCVEYSGKGDGFLDESYALKEVEKDCFRYTVDIACNFHKQSESQFMMCSQSIVKRLAYTICDHCCCDLDITLVAGKHVHKIRGKASSGEARRGSTEESQQERVDETEGSQQEHAHGTEENAPVEEALAEQCQYGSCNIPDSVDSSTKKVQDDLAKMNAKEMQLYYSAFLHNLMEGNVKFDLEKEMKERDYMYLRSFNDDEVSHDPFSRQNGSALPTAAEELQSYRRYQNLQMRNMVLARVKAREARESREVYKKKLAEEATAKREETRSVDEVNK